MAGDYGATMGDALAPAHGSRPARGYDYVMVLDAERGPDAWRGLLRRLRRAGFCYALQAVPAEGRVLLKIGMEEDLLMDKAEAVGMELELQPKFGGGFMAFERKQAACFVGAVRKAQGMGYFYKSDVVLLTLAALASREAWGAGVDVDRLLHSGEVLAAYAMHHEPERRVILEEAVWGRPWWEPVAEGTLMRMKRYLGAGVTLYVAFVSFYARYLRGIAGLAVPVTVVLWVFEDSDVVVAGVRTLFGLAVVFWATYFLEYWKRRNAVLNVKWGLSDVVFEADSEVRPQYQGEYRPGFWCPGGFVHLTDLREDRGHKGGDEGTRVRGMMNRDGLHHTKDTSKREEDPDMAAAVVASGISRSDGVEPVASGTVDAGPQPNPPEQPDLVECDSMVIGGSDDDMFRVEAIATGVTFRDLPSYPMAIKGEMKRRKAIGIAVTAFFTIVVGLATFLLLYFRLEMIVGLSRGPLAFLAPLAPGVLTGLLISASDALWRKVSISLTRWENHRTNKAQNNSIVLKRFAFQFVSNYSSLFYIAFVKPHTPDDACLPGRDGVTPDCMMELRSQLIGMVLIKATVMQLVEVGMPYIMGHVNMYLQREAQESFQEEISAQEHDRLVATGAVVDDDNNKYLNESKLAPRYETMDDFGELTIQYGYFCLFGLSWPLAAVFQLIDLSIESRTDVFKIVAASQMPNAVDVGDTGMWLPIMEFLRTASIVTNAALIVFTDRALDDFFPDGWEPNPVLAFLVIEHALFGVKWIISSLVNEVPGRTKRLLARQEFFIARWFNRGWQSHFKGTDFAEHERLLDE